MKIKSKSDVKECAFLNYDMLAKCGPVEWMKRKWTADD